MFHTEHSPGSSWSLDNHRRKSCIQNTSRDFKLAWFTTQSWYLTFHRMLRSIECGAADWTAAESCWLASMRSPRNFLSALRSAWRRRSSDGAWLIWMEMVAERGSRHCRNVFWEMWWDWYNVLDGIRGIRSCKSCPSIVNNQIFKCPITNPWIIFKSNKYAFVLSNHYFSSPASAVKVAKACQWSYSS